MHFAEDNHCRNEGCVAGVHPGTKPQPRVTRKKMTGTGFFTRRIHARTYCRAHIVFIATDKEIIHKGIMYNFSPGGIYFETARYLPPGIGITVKLRKGVLGAGRHENEHPRQFRGRVVWCRFRDDQYPELFGIGVKFDDIGFSAAADRLIDEGIMS